MIRIVARHESSIARSRAVVGSAESLDFVAAERTSSDGDISLRWILVHLIEGYARHGRRADLIRESIDGATGD